MFQFIYQHIKYAFMQPGILEFKFHYFIERQTK